MFKTSRVFPTDLNDHNTLFGGKILAEMDMVASISASGHSRKECVTASMDWVDFLHPVRSSDCVSYESFVIWTGRTSMEVFVKVVAEDLISGEKRIAATSFVTFVALSKENNPVPVPRLSLKQKKRKNYIVLLCYVQNSVIYVRQRVRK